MKACEDCHVAVKNPEKEFCPLCGGGLLPVPADGGFIEVHNPYPDLSGRRVKDNLIQKVFLFITLFGCAMSVLVNWLTTPGFWWSLVVLAASAYCWITIPPLLRRGANYATRVVWQVIFSAMFILAVDAVVGYSGWSVTYVIPGLLNAGILGIGLLALLSRASHQQYLFSQVCMGVFALVPLVLYLLDIAQNLVLVLVTAGMGVASILATLVFGDKEELRRRFQV